jgi:hypothetical protein
MAMVEATRERFPRFLPYGRTDPGIVPRLTVGEAGPRLDADVLLTGSERELGPRLPMIRFRVDAATVLVERRDETWGAGRLFALGPA